MNNIKAMEFLYDKVAFVDPISKQRKYAYIPNNKGLAERDIKSTFIDAYMQENEIALKLRDMICLTDSVSDRLFERYAIMHALDKPGRWKGSITYKSLKFDASEVDIHMFADGYEWTLEDELNNLTVKNILSIVSEHASDYNWIWLDQLVAILTNTVSDYMPAIPVTSFDGLALINSTSGRFMPAASEPAWLGGNVITGTFVTGTPVLSALINDLEYGLEYFDRVEDSHNERSFFAPQLNIENLPGDSRKFIVLFNPAISRWMEKVTKENLIPVTAGSQVNMYFGDKRFVFIPYKGVPITKAYMVLADTKRKTRRIALSCKGDYGIPKIATFGWETQPELRETLKRNWSCFDAYGMIPAVPQCVCEIQFS